jgi:predicted GTPase
MHSLGLNLYSNFPSNYKGTKNNTKYAYQNKVRALIMGHCGNGKSHFINNMCNTNLGMGIKAGSYTRDIDYKSCQFFP